MAFNLGMLLKQQYGQPALGGTYRTQPFTGAQPGYGGMMSAGGSSGFNERTGSVAPQFNAAPVAAPQFGQPPQYGINPVTQPPAYTAAPAGNTFTGGYAPTGGNIWGGGGNQYGALMNMLRQRGMMR